MRAAEHTIGTSSAEARVCFFSFCASLGGIANYQALQIQYLARRVPVLFLGEKPRSTFKGLPRDLWDMVTTATIPVWTRPVECVRSVWRVLFCWRPSVVVVSNLGLMVLWAPLFRMLRWFTGCQILHVYHSRRTTPSVKGYLLEVLVSLAHLNASHSVYVSEFTKHAWESRYPWMRISPGRVVPNAVPLEGAAIEGLGAHGVADMRPAGARCIVGFVGRLEEEKGARLFCDVARVLFEAGAPVQFEIFGGGSQRPALEAEFRPYVRFNGVEFDKDIIFKQMNLLVVTSRIENAPYVVLEAKARGIPVVSARIGGIPELVESGVDGVLCDKRTIQDYRNAILEAVRILPHLREGCLSNRVKFNHAVVAPLMWKPFVGAGEGRAET